jgi:hypothetical protein
VHVCVCVCVDGCKDGRIVGSLVGRVNGMLVLGMLNECLVENEHLRYTTYLIFIILKYVKIIPPQKNNILHNYKGSVNCLRGVLLHLTTPPEQCHHV